VVNSSSNSLPTDDEVTPDWLIEQLTIELIRQDSVLGRDFIALGRMSRVTKGPNGVMTVFFGLRCACNVSAVVSFEVALDKTKNNILEVLPQTGQRFFSQHSTFRQMPCSAHDRLRTGSLNKA